MITYRAPRTPEVTALEQRNAEFVRRRSGECMVLLESDGSLPLKQPGKIALYGNGARATVKGGTGSGDVYSRTVTTIEQGLLAAGFTVTSGSWLDAQQAAAQAEHEARMAWLTAEAAKNNEAIKLTMLKNAWVPTALAPLTEAQIAESDTDTAVYVLARNSGEGADRFDAPGDYQLTEAEKTLLTQLGKHYRHVILLLNVGGILDAPAFKSIPGVGTVLLISQSGAMGGHIAADVLLGKCIPSGRLTDTWPLRYSDFPSSAEFSHNNGDISDEFYKDGIYVGYRYFDTFNVTPAYPFGYGLSYTVFSTETLSTAVTGDRVSVRVRVTNIGSTHAGREVVQVYASAPAGRLEKPYQVLAAFAKTRLLAPGESQELTIGFPVQNLESYDPAWAAYVLEAGTYYIRVGRHSRATAIAAALRLDKDVITKQVKNICPLDVEFEEISSAGIAPYSYPEEAAQKAAAPVIELNPAAIPSVAVEYPGQPLPLPAAGTDHKITLTEVRQGQYTLKQLVAQLTVEEMADLCVGIARNGTSVIGMNARVVPGAAGDTSTLLADRDVRGMTNADGPAGLRLSPHFCTDAEGNVVARSIPLPNGTPDPIQCPEGGLDYYQYCTAIPIAWLLASSWDLELIESYGDMVGSEMEAFGVRVWLAPGMNIHRNPLCGRNFEYYSEDPLLSGLCAAADVKGVQRHPGLGTSIKHFFANNQEDNRMYLNAHIKERAIREIYLRNFGVAIQACQPMTIMTSYNLINGVHAANCYDSITCYARAENGFAGYVMTDWYTSNAVLSKLYSQNPVKYEHASSPLCVYAGNDVQMPGCQPNVDEMLAAVRDGSLPLGYLQQCCLRLLTADLGCACFDEAGPWAADLPRAAFVTVED